jgi:iron complex outermembrane receptor protein
MLRSFLICSFLTLYITINAQYSISGIVENENGELIEFASIFLEGTTYAAVSNSNGSYTIKDISPGNYIIKCTYLGYEPFILSVTIIDANRNLDIQLQGDIFQLDKIEIIANRVEEEDAFTYTNVSKKELSKWNNGQDMPYLLRFTPSVVVTSDAGNGVGYTGVRLRGTDATRVNVTINGIPLNDAESQGVFWVNLPDFGSSAENIQIQRGVGTSTSGVGAFGGAINLNTKSIKINPYASVTTGVGSYATNRLSLKLGTGLINDKYSIDLRYSAINSDGYIDRASSKLRSLFFGASRISNNSSTRLQVFSGSEVTYQAWYGVPQAKLNGSDGDLLTHYFNNKGSIYETNADSINLFVSDRRYNYYLYDNQVDDYQQTHVQLHDHRKISGSWVLNSALNFTHGSGFFEEYKINESLIKYGSSSGGFSDIIRRRWLDNLFYGGNLNLHYNDPNRQLSIGISAFQYDGDHFGKVEDVVSLNDFTPGGTYYFNVGKKRDLSAFVKANNKISESISLIADLQVRRVDYKVVGDDNDGQMLDLQNDFTFFNPKIGLNYELNDHSLAYASLAIANKEPNRSDFIDNQLNSRPTKEKLYDLELGYQYKTDHFFGELVLYNMIYRDQLVLTGALNDVGSSLRTNVPESFRRGVELNLNKQISNWQLGFTGTMSTNKIKNFNEVLYDYTDGFEEIVIAHKDVNIAFAPSLIFTAQVGYKFSEELGITLMNQYVSDQYLDNTANENRKLESYLVGDLLLEYSPELSFAKNVTFKAEVRNLWDRFYASNGYSYSYLFGSLITENFYYPQAGRNIMFTLQMDFGK